MVRPVVRRWRWVRWGSGGLGLVGGREDEGGEGLEEGL